MRNLWARWGSARWPSFSTRGHPLGSRHALIFHPRDSTVAWTKKLPGDNAANDAGLLFVKLKKWGRPSDVWRAWPIRYSSWDSTLYIFPFFPFVPILLLFLFLFFFVPSSSFFVWQLYSFTVRLLSGKLDFYLNCSRKQILMSLILLKRKWL